MQDTAKAQEIVNQTTGKGLETMALWADANQRVLRDLVDLSTGTAKETLRLYTEMQQSAIDAFRDGQAAALGWQTGWQDVPKDPAQWYQRTVADVVEGTQKWFQFVESNAQAVTRSAERMQASAEQTGKGMQQTFSDLVGRMKEVYAR